MSENLYKKLIDYSKSDIYPFCMPGHKRQAGVSTFAGDHTVSDPYQLDITEVEGFDDLHRAEGILKDITDHINDLYAGLDPYGQTTPKAFMSVNGSTACNLAAVNAVSRDGALLAAANCHRSVFNGAKLSGKKVIELAPEWIPGLEIYGGIDPKIVENALKAYPEIDTVVITSPSYEGFVSDIKTIADIVHMHEAYLVVDEAHGAHLPFCKGFPISALYLGADIVVHSLHKTMGSLNQTALAFVTEPSLAEDFGKNLLMVTTTSPSYLLMASIDGAMLWAENHKEVFELYEERLFNIRKMLAEGQRAYNANEEYKTEKPDRGSKKHQEENGAIVDLLKYEGLAIIDKSFIGKYNIFDLDPSKILFFKKKLSGKELFYRFLNEHHLQFEKYDEKYALAMTSVFDTEEGFKRLLAAARGLDECTLR